MLFAISCPMNQDTQTCNMSEGSDHFFCKKLYFLRKKTFPLPLIVEFACIATLQICIKLLNFTTHTKGTSAAEGSDHQSPPTQQTL